MIRLLGRVMWCGAVHGWGRYVETWGAVCGLLMCGRRFPQAVDDQRERGSILAAINLGWGGYNTLVSIGVGVGTPSSLLDA